MKNEFAGAKIDLFKMKKINASRPRLVFKLQNYETVKNFLLWLTI